MSIVLADWGAPHVLAPALRFSVHSAPRGSGACGAHDGRPPHATDKTCKILGCTRLPTGCVARRHVRCAPRTHPGDRGGRALGSPQGLGTAQRAASAAETRRPPMRRPHRFRRHHGCTGPSPCGIPATSPPQPRVHRATAHGGRCASSQPGHPQPRPLAVQCQALATSPPPHHRSRRGARRRHSVADHLAPDAQPCRRAAESVPTRLFARRLCCATARALCTPHASWKPWWRGAGEPARAWHCTASGLGRGGPLAADATAA